MPDPTLSFYVEVHLAWNRQAARDHPYGHPLCMGGTAPYEPDEHDCYELAGDLRVGLDAAGVQITKLDRQQPRSWLERRAAGGHLSISITETPIAADMHASGFAAGAREGYIAGRRDRG